MKSIKDIQNDIIEEFAVFDDWMDKYAYLIEFADELPRIDEKLKDSNHLLDGCQSRVWLDVRLEDGVVRITGDSDAILVKGLVSMVLRVYNGHTPKEVVESELFFIDAIGMQENLSSTRTNGLLAMINKIVTLSKEMM